jgi:hypothetical protein
VSLEYDVISDNIINDTGPTLTMIDHSNIKNFGQSYIFLAPMVSFPIALVQNTPVENLVLTREALVSILLNGIQWNDPILVALNPGLSDFSYPTILAYNSELTGINQAIIDYLFPGQNYTKDGDWSQIIAQSEVMTFAGTSDGQVLESVVLSTGAIGFVPLPVIISSSGKFADIYFGNIGMTSTPDGIPLTTMVITNITEPIKTVVSTDNTDQLIVTADGSIPQWPLNIFGYFAYQENATGSYNSLVQEIRFAYWSFNNSLLLNDVASRGFAFVNADTTSHLLEATFNGEKLLVYENFSVHGRSKAVLGISVSCTAVFFFVLASMRLPVLLKKKGLKATTHILLVLFGLVFLFASFIAWYIPPSTTPICFARMWFFGLGMTAVVSSIFLFGVNLQLLKSLESTEVDTQVKTTPIAVLGASITVMFFELIILLAWSFAEDPQGHEIITNQIEWQSRYTCSTKTNVMELVQYGYLCALVLVAPWVVNKYWYTAKMQDDFRVLLFASYSVLLILVIIMIVNNTTSQNDEQTYITNVIMFTVIAGTVVGTWMMPIISKCLSPCNSEIALETTTEGQVSSSTV